MNATPVSSVAILGASGMLARSLRDEAARRGIEVRAFEGRAALDITDATTYDRLLVDGPPDAVINAAAWTDVDGAETNEAAALKLNATGPGELARWCADRDLPLVHYSTDYVFDGHAERPVAVDAATAPINAYGRTKLAGEVAIRGARGRHLILRTSWLFAGHGTNFLRTMCRLGRERDTLKVVDDQHGRPTSCSTLARLTLDLLATGTSGTFHACNDGETTWCGFARAIMAAAEIDCVVEPCSSDAFPRPAARPAYGVLDLALTRDLVGPIEAWTDALARIVGGGIIAGS